jgi:hypothetical protein
VHAYVPSLYAHCLVRHVAFQFEHRRSHWYACVTRPIAAFGLAVLVILYYYTYSFTPCWLNGRASLSYSPIVGDSNPQAKVVGSSPTFGIRLTVLVGEARDFTIDHVCNERTF